MKIDSFASSIVTPEKVPDTPENPPNRIRTGGRFSPTDNQQKMLLSMQSVHNFLFHSKVEFSSLEKIG